MTTETIRPTVHFTADTLERAVDDAAGRIVADEIRYSVSALVHGLMRSTSCMTSKQMETLGIDYDDMVRLAYREPDADDYRDADQCALVIERAADGSWNWGEGEEVDGTESTELDAWREAFGATGQDAPNGAEVFEHWLVTDWLADKLRAKGETVVNDVAGLTIWGRATTGQMIRMDSVIREIAREAHDLPRTVEG